MSCITLKDGEKCVQHDDLAFKWCIVFFFCVYGVRHSFNDIRYSYVSFFLFAILYHFLRLAHFLPKIKPFLSSLYHLLALNNSFSCYIQLQINPKLDKKEIWKKQTQNRIDFFFVNSVKVNQLLLKFSLDSQVMEGEGRW